MATTLQKLVRRSQPTRIFSALHTPPPPNPKAPLIFGLPHCIETKSEPHITANLSSFYIPHRTDDLPNSSFRHIYPIFPFGFCLKPISLCGSVASEAEDVPDDSGKVWADSVKKKRKRKMNKHKYKKLRKRLRRQT